jgi:STE24 endopeptidase
MAGMRKAGAAALAGLGAITPMLARAAAFDVDHATALYLAMLGPAARARSDAYFDGRVWIDVFSSLLTVVVCWLILRSAVLVRCRDAMRRRGWRPWVVMLTVSVLFLACLMLVEAPWTIAVDFLRERRFGLMNQSFGGWLGDQAIGAILTLIVGGALLTVINTVMRTFVRTWWIVGAGVVGLFLVLISLVAPVIVMPMFNSYTDLPAGPLRTRIVAMAKANAIPADNIYEFNASRQSNRISANVSGIGPTVRISMTDNLVNQTSVAEAAAVVGHEMGHYVLNHIWRGIMFMTLLTALELWLLAKLGPVAIHLGGRRRAVRGIDDPAALPVLAGVLTLLSLLFLPISNTASRLSESEADAFGLETAREPDGFALTAMKLANYRKIAPPALEEALFYDHPSGQTRVRMAMEWKKDHLPDAREVVPPHLPDPAAP